MCRDKESNPHPSVVVRRMGTFRIVRLGLCSKASWYGEGVVWWDSSTWWCDQAPTQDWYEVRGGSRGSALPPSHQLWRLQSKLT